MTRPSKNSSAANRRAKVSGPRHAVPKLVVLEDRTVPAIITVTSLADDTNPGGGVTLREAIQAAESDSSVDGSTAGSGADIIRFAPGLFSGGDATINVTLTGDNTAGASAFKITTKIGIEGPTGANGLTIQGAGSASNNRFAHVSPTGDLTLTNLNVSGFRHKGGNGAGGNGGGGSAGGAAGLGGAIFNEGSLAVVSSTLSGNFAVGGNGNTGQSTSSFGGGGGGLLTNGNDDGNGGGPNGGTPNGGAGGFGGGGGGGIQADASGGQGGFGGGGGAGAHKNGVGGKGGFGGGGGGGGRKGSAGAGGFGGGAGVTAPDDSTIGAGGGGAGMGGAIFNYGGTVTITNSTLAGNTAAGGTGAANGSGLGGAVFSRDGTVTVTNSTLAGNTAVEGGGAVYALGDTATVTVTLNNSILADSVGASDFDSAVLSGARSFLGVANLIESNAGGGNGYTGAIVSSNDPLLGPLTDNGGPTLTMAITDASPAFNKGNNSAATGLTTDQRGTGFPRISGGIVDLGAYEFAALPGGKITATQIDDGTRQRSMIRSIKLTFEAAVTQAELPTLLAKLSLTRNGGLPAGTTLVLSATLDITGLMATIKFTGTSVIGGSLMDGRYTLMYGTKTVLEGNTLFRLFGDLDGDGRVSTNANPPSPGGINEEAAMAAIANNTRKGFGPYSEYLDYNSNGVITTDDRAQFNLRKGTSLPGGSPP